MVYDHKKIEERWRGRWLKNKIYQPDLKKAKRPFYNLMMFPYPSAEGLHVGNMYAFTGADVHGRFARMQGYDVFEPIGLDGFGIHSENYALKVGRHPAQQAKITEKHFYEQLGMIGNGFAWDNRLETYDPEYYRWTQWLFVQMYKKGLAYRGKGLVNWCPSCQTVLADEQVEGGVCERCKTEVIKKEMEQWFFKITAYADRLLANLDKIDWPKKIKIAQRNWIGKSKGLSIKFQTPNSKFQIEVWTKFWETVFGTTFLVLAPEHPLVEKLASKSEARKYVQRALKKTEQERKAAREKTGVFTGAYALNPVNGKEVPIWVADYVLMDVGTGAVMGVPAHDERDFEFAKKYDLDMVPVVVPEREYPDRNAKDYYYRRSQLHKDLLINLAKDAYKAKKKLMVTGGWAVFLQTESEFRDFEDLDLVVLESDLKWWREKFSALGFEISNLFPEGKNPEFYFQATKKDTHVDISVIRIDKNGEVVWLETEKPKKLGTPFSDLFEEKKLQGIPIFALSKEFLYRWKTDNAKTELRWKEKADFLFMGYNSYEGPGRIINSGKFDGLQAGGEGKEKMASWMVKEEFASWKTTYHLRDWLISRQRYWGPPIPMIHCQDCGWQPVPEEDLPVILPEVKEWRPGSGRAGKSPLETASESWLYTECPNCGKKAKRETDVSDTFLDSAWYFLRYPSIRSAHSGQVPFDPKITRKWLPVNAYIGGAEHAVLHLLYSRFVTMALYDWGYVDFEEPFPFLFSHGLIIKDGAKMSKSRGNVVNPDEYIDRYGADALRMYLMFVGPYGQGGDFRDTGMVGMYRFLERVWRAFQEVTSTKEISTPDLKRKLHQTIKKVTEDLAKFKYNTSIAALMELVNVWRDKAMSKQDALSVVKLLAPLAPYVAEELWQQLTGSKSSKSSTSRFESIHTQSWPEYDEKLVREEEVTIVVQVNGKVRASFAAKQPIANSKLQIVKLAQERVQRYLEGKKIKNTVWVAQKLVNFVIE
jgi:leucyl-tRNA synthetase